MSIKVSDHVLQRLREWGVEHVFAYAGDGINGLLAAWGRADNRPMFVQARHEETAALQAVGYAKFSGRTGVCAATSGPGAIHLLNGLYDAKLDHVPVVAIVGQTNRSAMGGSYQQEVDLLSLFKDVAEYCEMVTVPQQLPNVIDRAMRTAAARRTVTAVIIPADVQELEYSPPEHAFKMVPSSLGIAPSLPVPGDDDLARAAEVLNAGKKPAILIGQGARGAEAEIDRLADLLGAGVAKALLGKDVLPDDLPYVTGAIGLLGTRPSYELMRDCDTLLVVGSSFPYTQFLPEFDQARAVQIDIDPFMVGLRYPFEVNLVGDAKTTLARLLPLLDRKKKNRRWRETVEKNTARWWEVMERRAAVEADPINPEYVVHTLDAFLPEDTVIAADSGSATNWYARHLRMRGRMRGSVSGTLATMGCGVPYALGAKFAHPGRLVVALVGDGAMQMNGMAELVTAAKYWEDWEDPRLIVAVLNNRDLNQVTWEMRAMTGAPQFLPSQALPDVPYAEFARSIGLEGARVEKPGDVTGAWEWALGADRPCVLDFVTDPAVPPIPPHASLDQIEAAAVAVLKGDSDRAAVLRQGFRAKVQEMLAGHTGRSGPKGRTGRRGHTGRTRLAGKR
ncbi:thiamine pyrophosphate-requiring protein [Streptomyces sp. NPDC002992]|uniref:thiamine pyrophosphate-requiring protein n=1 Tax=Streptomyces sp. NPDC002992 TaxID=3154273 RepID=UPI0033BE71C8